MRYIQLYLLLAVVMFLTSCIKDNPEGLDPNLPTRTVLVYLGGDNASLSSTLTSEIESLRKGWTYTGNRCLIYIDPVNDVPRLLSLRGGCSTYPVPFIDTLAVYPEENSASAEVFNRVIKDVVQLHPADSYGLIFASHASGWLPEGTLARPTRSVGNDANTGTVSTNTEMELADFAAAIPDGQFDFIIFEACLMSGVEVACELSNKTDYILASSAELIVPGFKPIYPTDLSLLFDTNLPVEQSLIAFAQAYYTYVNTQIGDYRSTTLSVIKTAGMPLLATQVSNVLAQNSSAAASINISSIQHFDRPGSYGDYPISPRYFDFGQYIELIASAEEYSAIEKLLNEIVVWKAATPSFMETYNGFTINRHSGLTTYIEQICFPKLNQSYHQTKWYKTTMKE